MNYAALDKNAWRPITFEGAEFPPTVMGISVLGSVLPELNDELDGWLWAFPICRGVTKSGPADKCHRCASRARDLMLEHRDLVLAGIAERLGPHGFDASATFRDWILALQQIAEISARTVGDCQWSSPALPGGREKMNEQAMLRQEYFESLEGNEPGNNLSKAGGDFGPHERRLQNQFGTRR